jgi:hypothetical protein
VLIAAWVEARSARDSVWPLLVRGLSAAPDVQAPPDGRLLFVTVRHDIADEMGVAVSEEQDLVYRGTQTGALADQVAEVVPGAVRQSVNVNSRRPVRPEPMR